ncbi:hypothetical protein TYRP_015001, partial [Tyrophagus putrescentiae]
TFSSERCGRLVISPPPAVLISCLLVVVVGHRACAIDRVHSSSLLHGQSLYDGQCLADFCTVKHQQHEK